MRSVASGLVLAVILVLAAWPAWAGQALTIRMVKASKQGKGVAPEIADLRGVLGDYLNFSNFELVDAKTMPLPASGSVTLKGGMTLTCSGPQNKLSISLMQGKREVIHTEMGIEDNRPVIIGGFPGAGGQMLIILTAR